MMMIQLIPRQPRNPHLPPKQPNRSAALSPEPESQYPHSANSIGLRPRSGKSSLRSNLRRIKQNSADSSRDEKPLFEDGPTDSLDKPPARDMRLTAKDNPKPQVGRTFLPLLNSKCLLFSACPDLTSKSWLIFDIRTWQKIEGSKEGRRREVASLTKIITFLTAIKELQRLDINPQNVLATVSKSAASCSGTTASLCIGMVLSLLDLYYGMMLPSGNDAAICVAELVGGILLAQKEKTLQLKYLGAYQYCKVLSQRRGSVSMFLQKMNELADTLGMVNSLFTNPTGLSQKTNFSSAEDICKATAEGMKSELFRTIVSTKRYSCVTRGEDSIRLSWQNTNKLLEEGWEGVKTGVTPSAGACLACCARVMSGGVPLQVGIVLLQCQSMEARWQEARLLLRYALEKRISY